MKRLLVCLLLLMNGGASAENINGNTLWEACEGGEDNLLYAFCVGYTTGLIEGTWWGGAFTIRSITEKQLTTEETNRAVGITLRYCAGDEVSNDQVFDVFMLKLQNSPAERHISARFLFHTAMIEAFPCQYE